MATFLVSLNEIFSIASLKIEMIPKFLFISQITKNLLLKLRKMKFYPDGDNLTQALQKDRYVKTGWPIY